MDEVGELTKAAAVGKGLPLVTGIVFDIKRCSIKDGPGLRTSVFLKGCPLRCAWCHNPESWAREPQADREGVVCGRVMSVAEVMAEVLPDKPFYGRMGGLTLSGGEPMFQPDFARALAEAARTAGVGVALDTSGEAPWEEYERILPFVDLFLYDIKATGAELHRRLVGTDGARILENLRRLGDAGARLRLRCPLVPGVNDSDEHRRHVEALAESVPGVEGVDWLSYHSLGREKYARFGIEPREMT